MTPSAADLEQRLLAVLPTRSKARTAAVAALVAEGATLFPALAALFEHENPRIVELVGHVLWQLSPRTPEEQAATLEGLARMLRSPRLKTQAEALSRLWRLREHDLLSPAQVSEHLALALRSPHRDAQWAGLRVLALGGDPALVPALVDYADGGEFRAPAIDALRALGAADDRTLAALDRALDSWSSEVRSAARRALKAAGKPARRSVWHAAPVDDLVLSQVHRLGGSPSKPFRPGIARPIGVNEEVISWRGYPAWAGVDPLGQVKEISAVAWYIDRCLTLPHAYRTEDRDFPKRRVLFMNGGIFDVEDGGRRVLYGVAMDDNHGCFCVDLLEEGRNPAVYHVGHVGEDPWRQFGSLSSFLRWLRPPPEQERG